jgi:hypothetical protein
MLNYGTSRRNEIEVYALGTLANLSSFVTSTSEFLKNIGLSGQPINQEAHL